MNVSIGPLVSSLIPVIASALLREGWSDRYSLLAGYLQEQENAERAVIVAHAAGSFAGYGTVLWLSDYPPFAARGIPEIKDLNVLPALRRRGIASAILDEAERVIAERSPVAGIGVGLFSDYGAAQILYARRGYVPDGRGLSYRGQTVRKDRQSLLTMAWCST